MRNTSTWSSPSFILEKMEYREMKPVALFYIMIVWPMLQHHCSACPTGTPWILYEGICYQKVNNKVFWPAARQACQDLGGDLAIVDNVGITTYLQSLGTPNNLWIGLTDVAQEGQFVWVNGENLSTSYMPFAIGPTGGFANTLERNCVEARLDGWRVKNCNTDDRRYLCSTINEITNVSLVATPTTNVFPGSEVTLICQVTVAAGVNTSDLMYQWVGVTGSGSTTTFVLGATDSNVQCQGATIADRWYHSDELTIEVEDIPTPTFFINQTVIIVGSSKIMYCISPAEDYVFQGYLWDQYDIINDNHIPIPGTTYSHDIIFPNEGVFNISCITHTQGFSSNDSAPITVHVIVLPQPLVEYLGPKSVLFFGNTYTFSCTSNLTLVEPQIVWRIGDNSGEMPLTVSEENSTVTCAITYDSVISVYSETFNIPAIYMPAAIVSQNHDGIYFMWNIYYFNCTSPLQDFEFSSYRWKKDVMEVSGTTNYQGIVLDTEGNVAVSCASHDEDITSPFSIPFIISVIEMPPPTVVRADGVVVFYVNNSHTFTCDSPLQQEHFSNYRWKINGDDVQGTSENYTMRQEAEDYVNISCGTQVDDLVAYGEAVSVHFIVMPTPTVVPIGHGPSMYVDNDYRINCSSPVHDIGVSAYRWDVNSEYVVENPQSDIMVHLDAIGPFNLVCRTEYGEASAESEMTVIDRIAVPEPSVEVMGGVNNFLVGISYTFQCQSDVRMYVTMYRFTNTDEILSPQPTNTISIMATDEIQRISCTVTVDNSVSPMSEEYELRGADIISVSAQATNLNPYPGTTVTLHCVVSMVEGFTDDDVIFTWIEHGDVVATTESRPLYVIPGRNMSTFCNARTSLTLQVSNTLTLTARDLPSPSLSINNERDDGMYEIGHFHTLTCQSEMVEDIITQYKWLSDGQLIEETVLDHLVIQAVSTYHNYTCAYSVNFENSTVSGIIPVRTESIENVQIENDGEFQSEWRPVVDFNFTLTCQATFKLRRTHEPSYRWMTEYIDVGDKQQYTLTPFSGYRQILRCEVIVGDDRKVSEKVTIVAQDVLSRPIVVAMTTTGIVHSGELLSGNSYTLRCFSSSKSDNSSVTWMKDGIQMICLTESGLEIRRFRSNLHSGNFQCTIHLSGMISVSEIFQIT